MVVGTLTMTIVGAALNYFIMLPFFAKFYGMPLDVIIGMGTEINSFISSKFTFVLICVAPFNLLKGVIDGLVTLLIYKRISMLIKSIGNKK